MSYTIEYKREAFKLPKGTTIPKGFGNSEHKTFDDEFLIFHSTGCNNVYPRSKDWYLVGTGWKFQVIQDVCRLAGYCEGGSIQLSGDKYISPEEYIKLYRDAMASAKVFTMDALKKSTGIYGAELLINEVALNKRAPVHVLKLYDELKNDRFVSHNDERYDRKVYQINFKDFTDWQRFAYYKHIATDFDGYAWMRSFDNQ